jgi:hypothetical protein
MGIEGWEAERWWRVRDGLFRIPKHIRLATPSFSRLRGSRPLAQANRLPAEENRHLAPEDSFHAKVERSLFRRSCFETEGIFGCGRLESS